MKPLILPPGYLHKTDEELGQWLIGAWLTYHATRCGVPTDPLPPGWIARLIEAGQRGGFAMIKDARLESALRAAARGDVAAAGKRVREHFTQQAVLRAVAPIVNTGMRVRKPTEKYRARRSRVAAADANMWQRRAVELWAMPQHTAKSASDIARLIDPVRWNTIRRYLHRSGK